MIALGCDLALDGPIGPHIRMLRSRPPTAAALQIAHVNASNCLFELRTNNIQHTTNDLLLVLALPVWISIYVFMSLYIRDEK